MTDTPDIERIIARLEAADGPSVDLFKEAFVAVHGPKPHRVHGGTAEEAWLDLHNPFYGHITRGAWIDAAMTLVPDEHIAGVLYHAQKRIQQTGFPKSTYRHRLICEILAAVLRARSS